MLFTVLPAHLNKVTCALMVLVLLFIAVNTVSAAVDNESNVEKAIGFLKQACVTSGSSLDVKVDANGSLRLKGLLGSGIKGSVVLSKQETSGLADAASAIAANQATEMRKCMAPYIEKIISSMLVGATKREDNRGITTPKINSESAYFKESEFNKVIRNLANLTDRHRSAKEIQTAIGLHIVKVRHYIKISLSNKFVVAARRYGQNDGVSGVDAFKIEEKGIEYALVKGLLD